MGVKISELTEAMAVQNTDLLPIVQNGETKKITKENLFNDTETEISNLETQVANLETQISDLIEYTTNEIAVGTWIDGKTIYRKVMIIEGTLGNNTPYPFGVTPDTVIRMDCLVKYSGSNDWRSLPWLYSMNDTIGNGSWAGGFYYRNPNIYFQAGTNLSNAGKTVFIMEYTK